MLVTTEAVGTILQVTTGDLTVGIQTGTIQEKHIASLKIEMEET